MSSIAQANQIAKLEERVAALEAAFSRPEICGTCTCRPEIETLKNKVQGLIMRSGKKSDG